MAVAASRRKEFGMSRIDDPRQQGEQSGAVGQTIRQKGAELRGAAHERLDSIKESAQQYYEHGRGKRGRMEGI